MTNTQSSVGDEVNDKLRIAVIGGGAIAELYHLPALEKNVATNGHVVVVDTNAERLEGLKSKFEIKATLSDYRELAGQVDAVIVATPPASHFAICKWCLENGLHVLCEKPLTEDIAEARELVELAARNSLQLGVNQTRRFFPTYQKIRELLDEGTLGELQSISYHDGVEFDWPAASPHHFSPGAKGAWSDTGVHLLDTVCYWVGSKPELVESLNDSVGGPEAMATVRLQHSECDIEIKVSRLGRLKNGFEIVGSEGSIEQEAEEWSEVIVKRPDGSQQRHKCGPRKRVYTDFADPMLANFIGAVRGREELIASGESTLGTIELLDAAYRDVELYQRSWNEFQFSTPEPKQRVLITGASGFLGGRVAELMHLSDAYEPVAAIRHWSRAARIARYPIEVTLCDILDEEQVDASVAKVDAIVHCAKADDRESIVSGTKNLLDAAVKHGIKKFVFLSTAEVYGPEVQGTITEDNPTPHSGRLYGDAKIEAEDVCREYADRVPLHILRPSLIYGPFSTSWSIDIAKRLLSGKWGQFEEHGDGYANLVYVDDLARCILSSLASHAKSGEAYNVNGPDELTWNTYFSLFNAALGLPELPSISTAKSRLRTWAMDKVDRVADKILDRYEDKLMEIYLQGGWMSRLMKKVKGELNSTPSSGELHDLFARKALYSDLKAQLELGYQPQTAIDQGIQLTVDWLKLHEIVPNDAEGQPDSIQKAVSEEHIKELVS